MRFVALEEVALVEDHDLELLGDQLVLLLGQQVVVDDADADVAEEIATCRKKPKNAMRLNFSLRSGPLVSSTDMSLDNK